MIVFKDVTETKALERARYRVIHHLSHELKTPLSIISTSLKTIEASKKTKTFERIRRNLKRLQNIQLEVEDIVTKQRVTPSGKILPRLEQILDLIELMAEEDPGHAEALNSLKQRIHTFFEIDAAEVQDVNISSLILKVAEQAERMSSHRDSTDSRRGTFRFSPSSSPGNTDSTPPSKPRCTLSLPGSSRIRNGGPRIP